MSRQHPAHVDKAIATFGSQVRLAHALGVTPGLVAQWHKRPIPLERCLQIERRTRALAAERHDDSLVVRCEELRPDVDWRVLRENPDTPHGAC